MRISRAFGLQFFLILNCRKWPISGICDASLVVFFCDRDRVIVDRELQGPISTVDSHISKLLS